MSNLPERPFFEDALALSAEIRDRQADLRQIWADAKECEGIGAEGVKRLKAAVKRALLTPEDRKVQDDFAADVDDLCRRLGAYAETELGAAAVRDLTRWARG